MAQTFSLENTLGAGRRLRSDLESAEQGRALNALRADSLRQQTEQRGQTFDENQQKANTQKLLLGIRIARQNPNMAGDVFDELVASGIANPQERQKAVDFAANDAQGFDQFLANFESELQFALGQLPKFGAPVAGQDVEGNALFRRFSPTGESRDVAGFTPPARGAGGGVTGSLQELQAINVDRQATGQTPLSTEEFLKTRRQTSVNQQAFNRFKSENPNDPTTFEEFTTRFAGGVEGAKTTGRGIAKREQELIDIGQRQADATAIIRRGLQLIDIIGTGRPEAIALAAKNLFGIAGADETELNANLGKAILAQLRTVFGAQFTEREGERLDFIEANFGKSTAGNKRLLQQTLKIMERAARRGKAAAKKAGDTFAEEEIQKALDFDLDPNAQQDNVAPEGTIIINPQGQRFIKQNGQWVPSG